MLLRHSLSVVSENGTKFTLFLQQRLFFYRVFGLRVLVFLEAFFWVHVEVDHLCRFWVFELLKHGAWQVFIFLLYRFGLIVLSLVGNRFLFIFFVIGDFERHPLGYESNRVESLSDDRDGFGSKIGEECYGNDVFGAKNLARLDLSGCTPKAESWDISNCEMLQELVLGGEDYEPMDGTAAITQLNLGNKPFLSSIDVRNTKVTSITATYCPRLKTVLAKNSSLSSIDLAEASPIEILQLPSTMSNLSFKNLPRLQYPGGLTFDGMGGIKSVLVTNCPRISSTQLPFCSRICSPKV